MGADLVGSDQRAGGDALWVAGQRLEHLGVELQLLRGGERARFAGLGGDLARVRAQRDPAKRRAIEQVADPDRADLRRLVERQAPDLRLGRAHDVRERELLECAVRLREVHAAPGTRIRRERAVRAGELSGIGGARNAAGRLAVAWLVAVVVNLVGQGDDEDHRLGHLLAVERDRDRLGLLAHRDRGVGGAERPDRVGTLEVSERVGRRHDQRTKVRFRRVLRRGGPDDHLDACRDPSTVLVAHTAAQT